MQPFGRNGYGPKIGGCAILGRGAGSPCNTMWPGPRPTSMLSFILIRQTIWPQYTNVTDRQVRQIDRQDRADNGPIAYKRSPQNHCYRPTQGRFMRLSIDDSMYTRSIIRQVSLKPNSITLASSELAPNMFGASSELASVIEFGFYCASHMRADVKYNIYNVG